MDDLLTLAALSVLLVSFGVGIVVGLTGMGGGALMTPALIFLGVNPDNPAAIPLYISLDYTPTGEHRNAVNLSVIDGEQGPGVDPVEAIYRKSLRLR